MFVSSPASMFETSNNANERVLLSQVRIDFDSRAAPAYATRDGT